MFRWDVDPGNLPEAELVHFGPDDFPDAEIASSPIRVVHGALPCSERPEEIARQAVRVAGRSGCRP